MIHCFCQKYHHDFIINQMPNLMFMGNKIMYSVMFVNVFPLCLVFGAATVEWHIA